MHKLTYLASLEHIEDNTYGYFLGAFDSYDFFDEKKPDSTFFAQRIVGTLPLIQFIDSYTIAIYFRVNEKFGNKYELDVTFPVEKWLTLYKKAREEENEKKEKEKKEND